MGVFQRYNSTQKPPLGSVLDPASSVGHATALAWIFNEGGGLKANDLLGRRQLTFPANPTVTWRPTPTGGGVLNNATGTNFASFPAYTTGTSFSIEAKIMIVTYPGAYGAVIVTTTPVSGMFVRNTGHFIYYFSGDHAQTTALSLYVWYHVVLSVNGGAGTWYLNGLPDGTVASVPSMALVNVFTDAGSEAGNYYLDWLRVYNRPLTGQEVQRLYLSPFHMIRGRQWPMPPSSTVAVLDEEGLIYHSRVIW